MRAHVADVVQDDNQNQLVGHTDDVTDHTKNWHKFAPVVPLTPSNFHSLDAPSNDDLDEASVSVVIWAEDIADELKNDFGQVRLGSRCLHASI